MTHEEGCIEIAVSDRTRVSPSDKPSELNDTCVKPFKYVPLCSACAEHSLTVFRRFCAGCEERKRIVAAKAASRG